MDEENIRREHFEAGRRAANSFGDWLPQGGAWLYPGAGMTDAVGVTEGAGVRPYARLLAALVMVVRGRAAMNAPRHRFGLCLVANPGLLCHLSAPANRSICN